MTQSEFETLLRVPPPADGSLPPPLTDITVVRTATGDAYWVRAMRRYLSPDRAAYEYRPEWLALRQRQYRPLDPSIAPHAKAPGADYTVRDYLRDVSAKHPHVKRRYAWEHDPKLAPPIYAALGAVILGAAWPLALSFMVGAGLGRREQNDYDLSRFGSSEKSNQANPSTDQTEADRQRLAQIESDLAANLSAGASPPNSSPADRPAPAPVRTLDAPPLEVPSPQDPHADKHYAGDYYPTEAHAPHPPSNK
jgi:hypothetical protein